MSDSETVHLAPDIFFSSTSTAISRMSLADIPHSLSILSVNALGWPSSSGIQHLLRSMCSNLLRARTGSSLSSAALRPFLTSSSSSMGENVHKDTTEKAAFLDATPLMAVASMSNTSPGLRTLIRGQSFVIGSAGYSLFESG